MEVDPSPSPSEHPAQSAPSTQPSSSAAAAAEEENENDRTVINSTEVSLAGLHASLPSNVRVRQTKETGRGLYAKETFKPGSVVLAVRPLVSVLSTSNLEAYCSYCCSPAPKGGLKRCTRCRKVWYCDATCQNNDWASHRMECPALLRWEATAPSSSLSIPPDAVRALGRILWGFQREGLNSTWTKEFAMMQSHRGNLPPTAFESHTHLAHSVVRYLGISSPEDMAPYGLNSAGDLVDLISRFTTNTFTLTSPSLTPIGTSISPTMALVNHSCEPNSVMVFPHTPNTPAIQEPRMHLVAIRDIAPGDEIVASYIDITLPRELRLKALKETYNFDCRCKLCRKKSENDPRSCMYCPKSCGGLCPLPTEENNLTRCNKCKAAVASTDAVLDAVRVGQEGLDKATTLQFKDPVKAKQLTTNLIPIMSTAGLTPSTHPLLAMLRLHLELLVEQLSIDLRQDLLDEAIRTAAKYSAGLSNILTFGHPVRAIALAELGKLLAVDEPSPNDQDTQDANANAGMVTFPPSGPARLKLALETLIRAREELNVAFGKGTGGGQVGKEVREAIVRLESEMKTWTQGIKNALEDARAAGKIPARSSAAS
ncbi:SET domain-containing protein [Panus rudis PR-1116 ss-1]|nr:SET domain-containing protein [Panus rudis PR-1116 ss-1]